MLERTCADALALLQEMFGSQVIRIGHWICALNPFSAWAADRYPEYQREGKVLMKISAFMLGSRVSSDATPGMPPMPVLSDPKAVLRPRYIPTEYSFGVAVGIRGVDFTKEMNVAFKINDPKGNELLSIGPNVFPPDSSGEEQSPPEYSSIVFTLQLDNVNFSQNGVYKFRVVFNGTELETQDIPVYSERRLPECQ